MVRRAAWLVLGVLALPLLGSLRADGPAAQGGGKKGAKPAPVAVVRQLELLRETIDLKEFQAPMTLKETLGLLVEKMTARGLELDLAIDREAFREENPDMADVLDTPVKFEPFPRRLTLAAALRHALDQVPTRNATYRVLPTHIEVTTAARVSPARLLVEPTTVRGPLDKVLQQLADMTGGSVVLDARVGDAAAAPVAATFRTPTPLQNAVRVLADAAGLKVVAADNVLYVTARTNATRFPRIVPPLPPVAAAP